MREPLYRSRRDRVIGGLAAGLSRSLGIDVTWVRLGWVLLAFATQGVAILIYLALLFVIPEEPEGAGDSSDTSEPADAGPPPSTVAAPGSARPTTPRSSDGSRNAALVVGLLLVAAGAWLLLRPYIDFDLGWPVIAIAFGVVLVLAALRTGGRPT